MSTTPEVHAAGRAAARAALRAGQAVEGISSRSCARSAPVATGTEASSCCRGSATIEEAELRVRGRPSDDVARVLRLDPTHERARVELARLASSTALARATQRSKRLRPRRPRAMSSRAQRCSASSPRTTDLQLGGLRACDRVVPRWLESIRRIRRHPALDHGARAPLRRTARTGPSCAA